MDVDASTPSTVPMSIWAMLGKEGTKRVKVDLSVNDLTLVSLKESVCQLLGSVSPSEIAVLYNGGILQDDQAVKKAKFSPMNVLVVIKVERNVDPPVDLAVAANNLTGQLPQISLALRTAFLNPDFIPTIMKIGESGMMENIMAIATGLENDPVGVAIIQDPAMIFQLSDFEQLKKLASTKPWVVEAFNFIAASVHQGQGPSGRRSGANNLLFNAGMLGDDEDMEEEDEESDARAPSGTGAAEPNSLITREHLSAALNSLTALSRGSGAGIGTSPSGSSLMDMLGSRGQSNLSSAAQPVPASMPFTAPPTTSNAHPSIGSNPVLTPEMVARAMSLAMQGMSPEARELRFNELRDQIARIQQGNTGSTATAGSTPSTQATQHSSTGQYASQLSQMRDMGITDQRLATLALRVSDGDVQTAVDLIFSGWTGEGADEEMPDEE